MAIRDSLHPEFHDGRSVGGTLQAGLLAACIGVVTLAACAPRQAIVESEPNSGAPTADGDLLTTLRADLRELADAQESFRTERGYYAARTSDLVFAASPGVRVDVIQGDRAGWSAVASSTASDAECGMYQGNVRSPRGYLTESGAIDCR
ncbi:MAG: hypothetical protein ACOC9N_00565 [Gemmatimonadota bacterium]